MSDNQAEPKAANDNQSKTNAKNEAKAKKAADKAAKKAAKAALPKMPRFCIALTILFALNFICTIANLAFTSRDLIQYDSSNLIDWLNIVLEMVTLWMIWCRFKIARPVVMCYSAFNIIADIWRTFFTSEATSYAAYAGKSATYAASVVLTLIVFCVFNLVLFLYFWRSKKLKAYLTQDFGITQETAIGQHKDIKVNRRSWPFWRNIIIYYCFFSLAGHWMESAFCMLIRAGIAPGEVNLNNTMLWRDWFYPFPMEGFAVVLIALFLYPLFVKLRNSFKVPAIGYAISFLINALVCVAIEYTMGCIVNADHHLWDYSNMFLNLNGQVCLQNGALFGLAASIICWIVYPLLERLLARVPRNVMNLVFVITVAAYAIPQALYLTDPPEPYRVELEQALADDSLPSDMREQYQSELDKLNQLESQGVELAGARETKK